MGTRSSTTSGILLGLLALATAPAGAESLQDPADWSGPYASVLGLGATSTVLGVSNKGNGTYGANANDESAKDSFDGAGVPLGYQRHYANGLVVGWEADWALLRQGGRQDTLVNSGNAWNGMTQASIVRETQWLSTARLRLGYARGPFMVNVTGGVAMAALTETRTQYGEGEHADADRRPLQRHGLELEFTRFRGDLMIAFDRSQ